MPIYRSFARPQYVTQAMVDAARLVGGDHNVLASIQIHNPYRAVGDRPRRMLIKSIYAQAEGGVTFGRYTHGRPSGARFEFNDLPYPANRPVESSLNADDGMFPHSTFDSGVTNVAADDGHPGRNTDEASMSGVGSVVAGPSNVVLRYLLPNSNNYPTMKQADRYLLDFVFLPATTLYLGEYYTHIERPGFGLLIRANEENVPMSVSAVWDEEDYGDAFGNEEVGDP